MSAHSLASPLSGKRIAVTGGAGFLGRVVVHRLRSRGADIFVPRSRDLDLRTVTGVRRLYDVVQPQIVIHLAAVCGGIGVNRLNPARFFFDNAIMGLLLIEEGRQKAIEKFVSIGTICAYPKHTPVPFVEDNLWAGYPEETNAPYGIAKKILLVQSQAYRDQYGFNAIYLLPVNLYGPRDNFDLQSSHVIPAMIRKFTMARKGHADRVTLWGSGEVSREFLYVDDCADAIVLATELYDQSKPVNIGSGREIRIRDLAGLIADLVGFKGEVNWDLSQPDGQPRRCVDTSRAELLFGFRARTSLEQGLRSTIEWWEAQRQWRHL